MKDPKVSITFEIPGATLDSEENCKKNKSFKYTTIHLEYFTGKGKDKKKNKETLNVGFRSNIPAKYHKTITEDIYEYMTSEAGIPLIDDWMKKHSRHIWSQYSRKQRLETHIKLMARELKAYNYSYEIID